MKTLNFLIRIWKKSYLLILGGAALIWFLIRVIPKPSRAAYPCQRAAFPLASAFVIWITGSLLSYRTLILAWRYLKKRKIGAALGLIISGMVIFSFSYVIFPSGKIQAGGFFRAEEIPELKLNYNVESDQFIDPRATVSIIKSESEDILSISREEVEEMVREAVTLAGGLDSVINDGDTVVLKPNIVESDFMGNALSAEANGMVTDWRVVAAVAKIVREINPSGLILVIEGSAGNSTAEAYEKLNYTGEYMPEVDEFLAIEEVSGEWQDFSSENLSTVLIPENKVLYPDYKLANGTAPYYYNRRYFEADVIISLPVLKNHESAGVTGAVKNMGIGGTPTNIYGNGPGQNGRWEVIKHDASDLHKFIHDFYFGCPAHFAIMDGIQGYSNGPNYTHGPNTIEGHQEQMGLIMASRDPVALDAIESLIMFDDPRFVSHLVHLDNSNIGCADPLAIRVKGVSVSEVKKDFPHESHKTLCDYTDDTGPGITVQQPELVDNRLILKLSNTDDLSRLDIVLDGQDYPKIVIGNFHNVEVDISSFTMTDSIVTIYAHDMYLNTEVFQFKVISQQPVGIEQSKGSPSLTVFPNPVIEQLHIKFENKFRGDFQYMLYTTTGRLVEMGSGYIGHGEEYETADLSRLTAGSYILLVSAGDERYSVRINKE